MALSKAEQIKQLKKELNDAYMERIKSENWHSERMIEWIKKGANSAVTSFTSGPQRNIAYAIEELKANLLGGKDGK